MCLSDITREVVVYDEFPAKLVAYDDIVMETQGVYITHTKELRIYK